MKGTTVWITKYALKRGLLERTVLDVLPGGRVRVEWPEYPYGRLVVGPDDWHASRELAERRADQMRRHKIAALRQTIRRLESIAFGEDTTHEDRQAVRHARVHHAGRRPPDRTGG